MLVVFSLTIVICHGQLALDSIREWKQLDFNFPNPRARADAIQKGTFVQRNAVPIDVDVDYQCKIHLENEDPLSPLISLSHLISAA